MEYNYYKYITNSNTIMTLTNISKLFYDYKFYNLKLNYENWFELTVFLKFQLIILIYY